jgi:hypothetical protein
MSISLVKNGFLLFTVKDVGAHPSRVFHSLFQAPAFRAMNSLQFKRVVSIDQRHNEGKPNKPTTAALLGTVWWDTYVYRRLGGSLQRVPLSKTSRLILVYPPGHVETSSSPQQDLHGGEDIDIFGHH